MPSSRNGGAKLHFFFELTKIIALFLFNFFLQIEYCLLLYKNRRKRIWFVFVKSGMENVIRIVEMRQV